MKYNIVWIDDRKDWVDSVIDSVRRSFDKREFVADIQCFETVSSARGVIPVNYVDLIIIDYNLPDGMKGNEFIAELREKRCFSEILFYSQDIGNVEGHEEDMHFLHISDKEGVEDKTEEIAEQAYRKYRNPAFIRGLLLSEFIDLENAIEDLMVDCFRAEGEYFRDSIIYKLGPSVGFEQKKKYVCTMIKSAKEKDESGEISAALDVINFTSNGFTEKIIKNRNVLAHAYPYYDPDNKTISLKSSVGDINNFNSDWFHEVRENIHKYKQKVKQIREMNLIEVINP